jgi:hypothetical protein
MRSRNLKRLYPLIFGVLPFVHVVASNPGQSRLTTLGLIVLALGAGFGLLYLIVYSATRGTNTAPLTPLIVLSAVAWFYLGPLAQRFLENITGMTINPLLLALVGILLSLAVLLRLRRRPRIVHLANTSLPLMALLLLGWSAIRVGFNEIRAKRTISTSGLVADLAAPIQAGRTISSLLDQPDVYLIVLDEYANSAVLQEVFGATNQVFEDSLRALGFTIPKLVRSNYTYTALSISSLVNFAHLTQVTTEVGRRSNDYSVPNYLVEHSRIVRFLKSRGYRFAFFPSHWLRATDHSQYADNEYQVGGGFNLRRALAATQLANLLYRFTILGAVGPLRPIYAEHIKRTFQGIRELDTGGKPTFVFAHLIFPHLPYVLNANCESDVPFHPGEPHLRYLDQVRCANTLILELVRELVHRPGKQPIILLQGDHGTAMRGFIETSTLEEVTPQQARERFGAFGAYYLPDGGGKLFTDTVTVVNVLRKVLNYYFRASLPPIPDHFYLSLEARPFDFIEFDPEILK